MKVKVIGCGGIGTKLIPLLAQYFNFHKDYKELVLIDGDLFEEKNKDRQSFSTFGNKAEILKKDLENLYKNVFFRSKNSYITLRTLFMIEENDIVFMCVDNHPTRKLVSDRCCQLSNVLLISGGNDYTDGNVQVHLRENNIDKTLPINNIYHPEIENDTSNHPADLKSCEREMVHSPQLLFMNNAIASAMLSAFYAWEQKKLNYDEIYVDLITGCNRPVKRCC